MGSILAQDYDFFLKERTNLAARYHGKYVAIVEERIVDVFETEQEAFERMAQKYPLGEFLIQRCVTELEDEVPVILTHVHF